jgi:hypothetical protein
MLDLDFRQEILWYLQWQYLFNEIRRAFSLLPEGRSKEVHSLSKGSYITQTLSL